MTDNKVKTTATETILLATIEALKTETTSIEEKETKLLTAAEALKMEKKALKKARDKELKEKQKREQKEKNDALEIALEQAMKDNDSSPKPVIDYLKRSPYIGVADLRSWSMGGDFKAGNGLKDILLAVVYHPKVTTRVLDDMYTYWESEFKKHHLLEVARAIAHNPKTSLYVALSYEEEFGSY